MILNLLTSLRQSTASGTAQHSLLWLSVFPALTVLLTLCQ
jgi:hypothetical protein